MPGRDYKKYSFIEIFKKTIRNYFNHFFVYHNFVRNYYLQME